MQPAFSTMIHASAVIHPNARIADSVRIGPFCVIGEHVQLDAGVELKSHVVVDGHTHIGEGTVVFPFASLGGQPQDLKFKGEASRLIIGKRNQIREHVTMNPGTEGGGMETRVGDDCLFMMSSHVAHDCVVGNRVILANNATLAGHVVVGDFALLGGLSAVHQFVRIGHHAVIGGMTGVENDVIPFGSVTGERGYLAGLNLVGLKRRGFDREAIHALRNAFKMIFESSDGVLAERAKRTRETYSSMHEVQEIVDFIQAQSHRSICTPKAQAEKESAAA
jgi:UDP-N-acetylglucosamine acyltransferase